MMVAGINIDKFNNALTGLGNRINFDQIATAATTAQSELSAVLTSKLGAAVGAIEGGFKSLTQEIDIADLASGIETVREKGIALLTDNPAGVNLKAAISDVNKTALQALTGLTNEITPGLNSLIASLPTPEAAAAAIQSVSGKNLDELQDVMKSMAPAANQALAAAATLKQSLDISGLGIAKDFGKTVSKSLASLNSYLNQGFGQPLKDLVEVTNSPLKTAVTSLIQDTGKLLPNALRLQINGLVDIGNFLGAATIVNPFSNLDLSAIETSLSSISTKLADNISNVPTALENVLPPSSVPVNNLGSNDKSWKGSSTPVVKPNSNQPGFSFTRISGQEELEAEFRTTTREITEVVVHWTEHFLDQDVGSDEIHLSHPNGIGYHYVIRKDGSIQRGRPINEQGEHAPFLNHDQYSIGVAIVGGYNCSSRTRDYSRQRSSSSINDSQWAALENLLNAFYTTVPGGNVLGHYQCTENQDEDIDPGIDMEAYIKEEFGKTNCISFHNNYPSFSILELNERNQAKQNIEALRALETDGGGAKAALTELEREYARSQGYLKVKGTSVPDVIERGV